VKEIVQVAQDLMARRYPGKAYSRSTEPRSAAPQAAWLTLMTRGRLAAAFGTWILRIPACRVARISSVSISAGNWKTRDAGRSAARARCSAGRTFLLRLSPDRYRHAIGVGIDGDVLRRESGHRNLEHVRLAAGRLVDIGVSLGAAERGETSAGRDATAAPCRHSVARKCPTAEVSGSPEGVLD